MKTCINPNDKKFQKIISQEEFSNPLLAEIEFIRVTETIKPETEELFDSNPILSNKEFSYFKDFIENINNDFTYKNITNIIDSLQLPIDIQLLNEIDLTNLFITFSNNLNTLEYAFTQSSFYVNENKDIIAINIKHPYFTEDKNKNIDRLTFTISNILISKLLTNKSKYIEPLSNFLETLKSQLINQC